MIETLTQPTLDGFEAATEATVDPGTTAAKRPPHACNGCDERWWGANIAHCAALDCHRTFSTVKNFDLHRDQHGERGRCLDPAGIAGLDYRDGMWRGPEMSDEAKARRFGGAS